jgi:hypothetical protein
MIGEWSEEHKDEDEANCACDHDLLWFRKAKGETAHFIDSKRVLPGLVDTIMCGCGGNGTCLIEYHTMLTLFRQTI